MQSLTLDQGDRYRSLYGREKEQLSNRSDHGRGCWRRLCQGLDRGSVYLTRSPECGRTVYRVILCHLNWCCRGVEGTRYSEIAKPRFERFTADDSFCIRVDLVNHDILLTCQ